MLSSFQFNPSPPRMNPSEVVTQESLTSDGHCYCCSTSVNPLLSVVGKKQLLKCNDTNYMKHTPTWKLFTLPYPDPLHGSSCIICPIFNKKQTNKFLLILSYFLHPCPSFHDSRVRGTPKITFTWSSLYPMSSLNMNPNWIIFLFFSYFFSLFFTYNLFPNFLFPDCYSFTLFAPLFFFLSLSLTLSAEWPECPLTWMSSAVSIER